MAVACGATICSPGTERGFSQRLSEPEPAFYRVETSRANTLWSWDALTALKASVIYPKADLLRGCRPTF